MAPPSPRRPGFSRRAQLGLFASYVVAILGAALGLLLVVTAQVDPAGHGRLQMLLTDIFSPVSQAGRSVVNGAREAGSSVGAYFSAASKNKAMSAELKAARRKLIEGQRDAHEVKRLSALLKIAQDAPQRVVAARLVSSTGSSSRRFAILAAGSSDGVALGQPVIAPEGVVGTVVAVGAISSRVQLITDTASTIPVKRVSDGLGAFAVGTGNGRLELRANAFGTSPFKRGDIFVTSGAGGVYRPGIPVAVGLTPGRDGTLAVPLASPSRLDFAIVERENIPQPPMPEGELPQAAE
jgi:rod shape-determining protein MreC